MKFVATCVACILLLAASNEIEARSTLLGRQQTSAFVARHSTDLDALLQIRGGATRKAKGKTASTKVSSKTATGKKKVGKEKEPKTTKEQFLKFYNGILPVTRVCITMLAISTLLAVVLGEEMFHSVMALDPMRIFYGMEVWRPFTAAAFLGPPSMGWLMNGYYLFTYGSTLERAFGRAQFTVFLLVQVVTLSALNMLIKMPFFGVSMIASMLHVLSRTTPRQEVQWIVFKIPHWALPYGMMFSDMLQAGDAQAAIPHVLGILSGHFYHFQRFVWPKIGGEDWISAPDFLIRLLDPDAKATDGKGSINKALKDRKRGKGKKLGK